jgi:SAM-dependent methyltransferase
VIVAPEKPSWSTWWSLSREQTTLLRSLENRFVRRLVLDGDTLDVGGGPAFDYVRHIRINGTLTSANIAPALKPDLVIDFNAPLPIESARYDNVLSLNTLEHVYEDRQLVSEMLRVLKPGGRFIISVPYLFKRHGNYGDFHRHTADYWEQALAGHGLATGDFRIHPLVWSPLTSGLASLTWFRAGLRGRLLKLLFLAGEPLAGMFSSSDDRRRSYRDFALAFFIEGRRPA